MTRPTRKERGIPAAGRRVTCQRALVRRTLAAARAGHELGGAADDDATRYAARGSLAAAELDAARRCSCESCPAYVRAAERRLAFTGTLKRHAAHAERIGAAARIGGGLTDDAVREHELLAARKPRPTVAGSLEAEASRARIDAEESRAEARRRDWARAADVALAAERRGVREERPGATREELHAAEWRALCSEAGGGVFLLLALKGSGILPE